MTDFPLFSQLKSSPIDMTEEVDECTTEKPAATSVSMVEQVDEIMDHSIEIESNKRMRSTNINVWTLKFRDIDMEKKVKEYQLSNSNFIIIAILCIYSLPPIGVTSNIFYILLISPKKKQMAF